MVRLADVLSERSAERDTGGARKGETAMKIGGCFLVLACTTLTHAGIRPSFWLSRCAWEATDVVELAVAPDNARFRVVASLKGGIRPGAIKVLPELTPPAGDHSLLKDLAFDLPNSRSYESAPPIRDVDRLIVFLRPGDKPANWTMLTSAIWLQDGVAYTFEQTMNPGPTHLVAYLPSAVQVDHGNAAWKASRKRTEGLVRADIGRLLRLRETFDYALANPSPMARAAELARLVTSGDDVVIRGALAKLGGEGPEAARALWPLLNNDSLLNTHFQILDTMAVTGALDIRLDSIIRRERSYWTQTCHRALDANWVRNYGQPPAFHYLRLVSALKTIRTLGINSDLPAVREFDKMMNECQHLSQQKELAEVIGTLLGR